MKKKLKGITVGSFIIILAGLLIPLPDPLFDNPYATTLESRGGHLLGARIARDGQWRFPPSDSLPDNYTACLLEFEDKYFFRHPGFNPVSIFRAIGQNLSAGKVVSGGSTITMQVARMALGNRRRTVPRKFLELLLALRIELKYSKREILRLYADNAPFGGNVVGISAAAWRYYGRSMYELSWAESANLAVLPNAPGLVFPGTNDRALLSKRNRILSGLLKNGVIDSTTYRLSIAEPLPGKPKPLPMIAQHLLDRSIGDGHGGTRVRSTVDYNLQNTVNGIVDDYHKFFSFKQIHNAAAIVANIKTGEVEVYVGNAGSLKSADHGQQVDIINRRRSPGSLLKPLLYALSIDKSIITPWQLLEDIPVYYQGFAPQNFDKKFKGAVPANLALRSSLNVPFVSLLRDYGYEQFHYDLKKMGIASLDKPAGHYGLSVILGGAEVTLWEMAGLYASTARTLQTYHRSKGAKRYDLHDFRPLSYRSDRKVRDEERSSDSPVSASAIWHMLKAMQELRRPDAESNWQQFGNSQAIAWKTGTSYGHKDAWAIGLNSKHVVGVWLGNADGEGRPDLTGILAAAPLMFRIFEVLDGNGHFPLPVADVGMLRICKLSGNTAGAYCTETEVLPVSTSAKQTPKCRHHKLVHLDQSKKYQVNSKCYRVEKMVEMPWFILPPAQARYYKQFNTDYAEPPEFLPGCTPEGEFIEMIYPRKFTRVYVPVEIDGKPGRVVFEAAHRNTATKVFWYLDREFLGETTRNHQMGIYPSVGNHVLNLVDEQGRELNVSFEAVNKRVAN
ncbi:MAG: penicillin-binding protein 1C [Cytophagales bacterium]|nr:penicillin-binding protein 1C [Cytophagales bacterium]